MWLIRYHGTTCSGLPAFLLAMMDKNRENGLLVEFHNYMIRSDHIWVEAWSFPSWNQALQTVPKKRKMPTEGQTWEWHCYQKWEYSNKSEWTQTNVVSMLIASRVTDTEKIFSRLERSFEHNLNKIVEKGTENKWAKFNPAQSPNEPRVTKPKSNNAWNATATESEGWHGEARSNIILPKKNAN